MTSDPTVGRFAPADLIIEADDGGLARVTPQATRIVLSIEQASQLVVSVSDPHRRLLRSKLAGQASRLALGPLTFALTGLRKTGPNLDLAFTDLGAVELSRLGADAVIRAVPAGIGSRGDFIADLAAETDVWTDTEVFRGGDPYQPGHDTTNLTATSGSDTITGVDGLVGVDLVVAAAAHPDGGRWAGESLVESVAVSLAENQNSDPDAVGENRDGTTDTGLWQINSIHPYDRARITDPVYNASWARRIKDDRDRITGGEGWRAFYAHTPYTPPGQPQAPYGSGEQFLAALPTARAAVDRHTAGQPARFTQPHAGLEVGTADQPTEDLWVATGRLAGDVNWRRFAAAGIFYAGPDEWLVSLTPPTKIRELAGGVGPIDFDTAAGVTADQATFPATTDLWTVRPGQPVVITDLGPASGIWIVAEVDRTGGDRQTAVKVTRIRPELPAPDNTIGPPATTADGGPPLVTVEAVTDSPPPTGGGPGPTIDISGAWAGSQAVCQYLTSGFADAGLTLASAKRNRRTTKSGGVSDHWVGNTDAYAEDWSNGPAPTPEMDAAARTVIARLGGSYDGHSELVHSSIHVVSGGTFRVQVLYRTWTGGNHFNHPHIGVERR